MKQNYKVFACALSLLLSFTLSTKLKSQSIIYSASPSACFNGSNQLTATCTATALGAVTYSWTYLIHACGSTPSFTTSTPNVTFNAPCAGTYSMECTLLSSSNSPLAFGMGMTQIYGIPTISASASPTIGCAGDFFTLTATSNSIGTYVWSNVSTGPVITMSTSSSVCYSVEVSAGANCTASTAVCVSISPSPTVTISGPDTVCKGSSATLVAHGADTYTWNTNSNADSLMILPLSTNAYYYISATDALTGCQGGNGHFITVDTTCAIVWPGDANRDGVVNTSDVLELGLAASSTGAARSVPGNAWSASYADAWLGNGSTGWNKAHADCNGDGTVNASDTVAIATNFFLTHAFKPSAETGSPNSDITLVSSNNVAYRNAWNKVDVILGSSSSQLAQLYGLSFDVNLDVSLLESNSYYIVYTSSMLNLNNQNIEFRKYDYPVGNIAAASVRTDHLNVSGYGKIAEIWFKVKSTATENDALAIQISNSRKISKDGVNTILSSTGTSLQVDITTGIKNNQISGLSFGVFPNPAKNIVNVNSDISEPVAYTISDLSGRKIVSGSFTKTTQLNISTVESGAYLIRFDNGTASCFKKLVIEK
ncbi:hypothetical protein CNR22_06460 [Sphingobacteriaceae bacterium]|nr:hypothetical protein CNR22_06460 [Sphingobacteriaceae bacterium]